MKYVSTVYIIEVPKKKDKSQKEHSITCGRLIKGRWVGVCVCADRTVFTDVLQTLWGHDSFYFSLKQAWTLITDILHLVLGFSCPDTNDSTFSLINLFCQYVTINYMEVNHLFECILSSSSADLPSLCF